MADTYMDTLRIGNRWMSRPHNKTKLFYDASHTQILSLNGFISKLVDIDCPE